METFQILMDWSSKLFPAGTPFPRYPPWNANEILSRIRAGQTGGFCAQYAHILGQALQGLGYSVRYVDLADADLKSRHFTVEVYSPKQGKWIVLEAQYGFLYTDRKGRPLGALEVHKAFVRGETLRGVGRAAPSPEAVAAQKALYRNLRVDLRNNFLSLPVFHSWLETDGKKSIAFFPSLMTWAGSGATASSVPGSVDNEAVFNFIPAPFPEAFQRWWTVDGFMTALSGLRAGQAVGVRVPASVLERAVRMMYDIPDDYSLLK